MTGSSPYIDISPTLRLLGTAHVATASVEAVREQIESYQPKVVGVELCQTRHDALVEGRRLDKEGLRRVIKEGKAPMVLIQAMLSAEQRRLGLNEGQEPGAELLAAVETAKSAGVPFILLENGYTEKKTSEIHHDHLIKDFVGIEEIIYKYLNH